MKMTNHEYQQLASRGFVLVMSDDGGMGCLHLDDFVEGMFKYDAKIAEEIFGRSDIQESKDDVSGALDYRGYWHAYSSNHPTVIICPARMTMLSGHATHVWENLDDRDV